MSSFSAQTLCQGHCQMDMALWQWLSCYFPLRMTLQTLTYSCSCCSAAIVPANDFWSWPQPEGCATGGTTPHNGKWMPFGMQQLKSSDPLLLFRPFGTGERSSQLQRKECLALRVHYFHVKLPPGHLKSNMNYPR